MRTSTRIGAAGLVLFCVLSMNPAERFSAELPASRISASYPPVHIAIRQEVKTPEVSVEPTSQRDPELIVDAVYHDQALEVSCTYKGKSVIKLFLQYNGRTDAYILPTDGRKVRIPLPGGNTKYTALIYESLGETNTLKNRQDIQVSQMTSEQYLVKLMDIQYKETDTCIRQARAYAQETTDPAQLAEKVYQELLESLSYDTPKVKTLRLGYIPNPEETYQSQAGICYDMASLYAAMLRSVHVPTRLCMGYAQGVSGYHAWNEVWTGEEWIIVDISTDVQLRALGRKTSMEKDASDYKKTKEY